jgi:hypothetical protein
MAVRLRATVEISGRSGAQSWEHVFRASPVRITRGDPQTARAPSQLAVPLPFVSSQHADIFFDEGGVFYKDVKSTNGMNLGATNLKDAGKVQIPPDQPLTLEGNEQVLSILLRTDEGEDRVVEDVGATIIEKVAMPRQETAERADGAQIRRLALLVRYSCAGIYDLIEAHRIRERRVGFTSLVGGSSLYKRKDAYDVEDWLMTVPDEEVKQALARLYQDVRVDCVAVPKAATTAAVGTFRQLSLRGRLGRMPVLGPLFRMVLGWFTPSIDPLESAFLTSFKQAYQEQQRTTPRAPTGPQA